VENLGSSQGEELERPIKPKDFKKAFLKFRQRKERNRGVDG